MTKTAVAYSGASDHAQDLAGAALDATRGELQRALALSAELNERLSENDRRKDEFLAMLGHELRNPMAAIAGALELARTRRGDGDAAARALAIIERQASQLGRIVDDLLDVGRITRGKIELRKETVDVGEVVARAIESLKALLLSKQHVLHVRRSGDAFVCGDPSRLEQIVANLLTNAVKYTEAGGRIELAIERAGAEVVLRVRDSGIGIPREMLREVFEPFVQVSPSFERSEGGVGIGLTLVRQLAELHGGRAEAKSEVGIGSEFSVHLPAVERSEPAETVAQLTTPTESGRRVLVVDDNTDSADMVAELMETWGHIAQRASDGPTALTVAASFRPHVVFLDLGLPGLDGYEVARRLRQMPETQHTRIIAVSGYGADSDRVRTRAAGFDAHLVKPADFSEMQRHIP